MTRISFSLACVAISVVAAGCTVHQTEAPGFTGPSEFALSVSMSADPDTLFSDGRQTATIQLSARDASGAPQANKTQIRQAVQALFKVKVAEVRTTTTAGKLRRRGKFAGYRSDWKKAYVKLKVGQKMPEYAEII